MRYTVTVEGQTYEIEISDTGQVWIDGRQHAVDLEAGDPNAVPDDVSSLISLILDQQTYEAHADRSSGQADWSVTIGGRRYDARVQRFVEQATSPDTTGLESDGRVVAPLPGLVLEVRVTSGQFVEAGDVLIVLESMKMQLEVRSPMRGVVAALHATPNQEVGERQPLIVISPDAPDEPDHPIGRHID